MNQYTAAIFLPNDRYIKESVDTLLAPYNLKLPAEAHYHGDELITDNPNGTWDWYEIGGRFRGKLILKDCREGFRGTFIHDKKPAKHYDGAFVRYIDFEAMQKRDLAEFPPFEEAMTDYSFSTEEDMRERFPNEEDYTKHCTLFSTYVVITPDGKLHACGDVSFGMPSSPDDEELDWKLAFHDRFIKPAIENNWYMVIIDCHTRI
jgi:hypothetical protein